MPGSAKEKEVINSVCFLMGTFKQFPTRLKQVLQGLPASGLLFYISLLLTPNNIYTETQGLGVEFQGRFNFSGFFFFFFF